MDDAKEVKDNFDQGLNIAIIGMAGRFPGAKDIDEFWENLCAGLETIRPVSDDELLASGISSAEFDDPDYVKVAAALDGVDLFDANFFGYTPLEATTMDPQQRLLLETAWQALEHAGYAPGTGAGPVGVFAGAKMNSYIAHLFSNTKFMATQDRLQLALGNDSASLSTRISYKLNLTGPSYMLQAACSTSLVAVHLACQSLLFGECRLALAGGAAIDVPQKAGYRYQYGSILSPDGHCRPFDAQAQGTVFGSGVGFVVLKRMEDALEDGDTIYAVVKGTATNNDGSQKASFTAPSVEGQTDVIIDALACSGVDVDSISYVETHGTGTALGDPIEIMALTNAFRAGTAKKGFCRIGSVKGNIGHLDAAAGMASLVKTVMALQHKMLPPSLHFEKPNPEIDFPNSPFVVNTGLSEWKAAGAEPLRAGVSAFGFGGANSHVILEQAPQGVKSGASRPSQLLMLSAKTSPALDEMTANLAAFLKQNPGTDLADVAYTLQVGRQAFDHRRTVVCGDLAESIDILETADSSRVLTAVRKTVDRPVVFMFPGQGAQYVNMGKELYATEVVFREQVDLCAERLLPQLGFDLRTVVYPEPSQVEIAAQKLEQTAVTQSALFAIEYALAKLWMSWGIMPKAMVGHSIGEYVAACLSGVFSLDDALMLVAARGKLMQALPPGAMLSVAASVSTISPFLNRTLSLAAVNGPSLCVVSGPADVVADLEEKLGAQNIVSTRLHTSHAFHSQMMEPILEPFTAQLKRVNLSAPRIPYLSNVTGTWITEQEALDPSYWATHIRQTVRFADGVHALLSDPQNILLEVGPSQTLSTLARQQISSMAETLVCTSMHHPKQEQSDVAFILTMLGRLWLAGEAVDWAGFYTHERRRRLPLPTYPFERQRYWVESSESDGLDKVFQDPLRKKPVGDWFYVPAWKQSVGPLPPVAREAGAQKSYWLLFCDTCGLGTQLAEKLKQQGHEIITVAAGTQFSQLDEYTYFVDPRSGNDYRTLFDAIQKSNKNPGSIVHLWQVMPHLQSSSRIEFSEECQSLGFHSLLLLVQALDLWNTSAPLRIQVISNNMHEVTNEHVSYPEKATVLGPCRVIPQEYPRFTCQSIDIDWSGPGGSQDENLLGQLVAELLDQSSDAVVAYRGCHRWVQTFDELPLGKFNTTTGPLREGGVYLITGGLGGLGLVISGYLAGAVRAKLVLTNRSAFPAQSGWDEWLAAHDHQDGTSTKIRALQAIESLGAEIMVVMADVTDLEQMRAAISEAEERFGTISGVIHTAGVAGGGVLQLKTPEMASAVLAPKVKGTLVLDELFKNASLDFFVLFSSLSAIVGELGQADYCAANAFLDSFAHQSVLMRNRRTLSINWHMWREAGMAVQTEVPMALRQWREEQLKLAISPGEGVDAFALILASGIFPQVAVSTTDLHTVIKNARELTQSQLLQGLSQLQSSGTKRSRPELRTSYATPTSETERVLVELWQRILGVEPIGIHDDFFELGGHSLLITQVLNDVRRTFKVELPLRSLFEHATVAGIAGLIEGGKGRVAEEDERPIAERIRTVFPTERLSLLEEYLAQKIALALDIDLNQLSEDGDLADADLEKISVDLMLNLKQDFQIQVFPQEIPRIPSVNAFARFVKTELDRQTDLTLLATDKPLSAYTLQPYRKQTTGRLSSKKSRSKKNKPVVFIHSSPRAGSTLLRVMLAGHPGLFGPPELHLLYFDTMQEWHKNLGFGDDLAWTGQGLEWAFVELLGIDSDESRKYVDRLVEKNESISNVYRQLQESAGGRLLIDKTPTYSLDPQTLRRAEQLFETPKYVHLVRHPYSVMDSFLRIRLDKLFGPNMFKEADVDPYVIAETVWATANRNLLEFLEEIEPERHLLVRYEEMVRDPLAVMSRLCQFLEIPFDDVVLCPYDGRRERMTGGLGDPNIFQHNQVDASLADTWKKIHLPHHLDPSTVALARQLGYDLPEEAVAGLAEPAEVDKLSADEVTAMLSELMAQDGESNE